LTTWATVSFSRKTVFHAVSYFVSTFQSWSYGFWKPRLHLHPEDRNSKGPPKHWYPTASLYGVTTQYQISHQEWILFCRHL